MVDQLGMLRGLAVIILAAGASRRFGRENKLLQPYRGKPLMSHILHAVEQLDLVQRLVVTGPPYADEVKQLLCAHQGWQECLNPDALQGMGTSIAAGAKQLGAHRGVFICPADMPDIGAEDFRETGALFHDRSSLCRPTYNESPGHPVLFGSAHFQNLRNLNGVNGGAVLIGDATTPVRTYASPNSGVIRDFDTPAQFEAITRSLEERI